MGYALHRPVYHRKFKLLPVLAAGLVVLACGLGGAGYYLLVHRHPAVKPVVTVKKAVPKPVAEGVTSHMLFVGDVFWGRSVQTSAEQSGKSYANITSGLSADDRAQYDAWIANFECPITTKDVPYQLQVDILKFNCRPEYLPELAKWFTAASQANNHTDNNDGKWGLDQTRTNLQTNHIQNFGTYDMNDTDDICEVITLPATTTVKNSHVSLPVALCGYMYVVDVTPTDAQLAVMQQYAKVMPVIAMPHMGVEYRTTAEPAKESAYRRMIDNGADMVVAAHPHVVQNSEAYNGKLIAYSMGNFLFDQQVLGRDTTLGLGVGLKLTIQDPSAAKIYEEISPACATYKDTCLEQLTAKLKARPKIDVAYNFTCYDEQNKLPHLGTQDVCAEVEKTASVDQLTGLATSW